MKSHNHAFGKALRELRKTKNLSQETLAFEAGLDRTYISLLELGQRSPTLDSMMALCHALKITLTQFVTAIEAGMEKQHE